MKRFTQLVSIIVPVHNEEKWLSSFIKEIGLLVRKNNINYELILVENGSHDKSWEFINNYKKNDKRIFCVKLKEAGYGLAIIEGLKKAKGALAIVFNVDFWDERFLTLTLIDMMEYDIILTSKLLPGSFDQRGIDRRLVSWGFNKFLRIFMGYKGTDTHGIKLFRLKNVMPLVKVCKTKTGIFDSELMLRAQRKKLKILELPITVKEIRPARFNYKRILVTPFDIWKLYYSYRKS